MCRCWPIASCSEFSGWVASQQIINEISSDIKSIVFDKGATIIYVSIFHPGTPYASKWTMWARMGFIQVGDCIERLGFMIDNCSVISIINMSDDAHQVILQYAGKYGMVYIQSGISNAMQLTLTSKVIDRWPPRGQIGIPWVETVFTLTTARTWLFWTVISELCGPGSQITDCWRTRQGRSVSKEDAGLPSLPRAVSRRSKWLVFDW